MVPNTMIQIKNNTANSLVKNVNTCHFRRSNVYSWWFGKFIAWTSQIPSCDVKEMVVEFNHRYEKRICYYCPKVSLWHTTITPTAWKVSVLQFFWSVFSRIRTRKLRIRTLFLHYIPCNATEVATGGVLLKKVFLKIPLMSQENTGKYMC